MMYVRERLLSIRLAERLKKQPELAERLAIEFRTAHRAHAKPTTTKERK